MFDQEWREKNSHAELACGNGCSSNGDSSLGKSSAILLIYYSGETENHNSFSIIDMMH